MNLKYILSKFKTFQFDNMMKVVEAIQKKTKRTKIGLIADILSCSLLYGAGYNDYYEFEFYLLNHKQRKTLLTGKINNLIVKTYNNAEDMLLFESKANFYKNFKEYLGREFLLLDNTNYEAFVDFVSARKSVVVKPLDSMGGNGVEKIDISAETDLKKLYQKLLDNHQYLVEEVIHQHPTMSLLNSASINTLRVISFVTDDHDVEILQIVLKIGQNDIKDNFSSGGMYTFVNEEGIVFIPAIDKDNNIYEYHPVSHTKIPGFQLPYYDEVIAFVKKLSLVIPSVRYVGWDIAITEHGPIVVEGNEYSGIFQAKPSLTHVKEGLLPKYKKYMKILQK